MDGERFDALTRLLAGPLLRRQLLRGVAGALAGAALAGRAAHAQCTGCDCCPEGTTSRTCTEGQDGLLPRRRGVCQDV